MDDNAHMLVWEAIIFAITIVITMTFLITLSPTSIYVESKTVTNLKAVGDDALAAIYSEKVTIDGYPLKGNTTNNPTSKLTVSIITNNYAAVRDSLNDMLPNNVLYNIYIGTSQGDKAFWYSSVGSTELKTSSNFTIFTSRQIIAIDPVHLTNYPSNYYKNGINHCIIIDNFPQAYWQNHDIYEVILEMWQAI